MKSRHWSVLLALSSLGFVILCAVQRRSLETVWGDESTYLAMAESLAEDGDLRFTEADALRIGPDVPNARSTVILQTTPVGVTYSKPILYALLAAPTVALAGSVWGPLALNGLFLAFASWLAWRLLCRLGRPGRAALTLVTFVGAGVLLAHVGWRTSDLVQASLSLAALALAIAPVRRGREEPGDWMDGRAAAWVAGLLLGLLVSARLPNLLIAAAAVLALAVCGHWRRVTRIVLIGGLAFVSVALVSRSMIGTSSPYRAVRSSFDGSEGYPLDPESPAFERFETHKTTQLMTWAPDLRPRLTAYSTLYFWVGRHSGLLFYFPAVIALLAPTLRRPDRPAAALVAGAFLVAAFYLVWWPDNYFGGAAFLGNRYFLVAYPLLLIALPRLPGRGALTVAWLLAGVMAASAIAAQRGVAFEDLTSQSHTLAGLPQRLPYESTARAIDGRRDRYWARHFVRFLDPTPEVGRDGFRLRPGDAPAQLMLVTRPGETSVLLRYRTRTPGLSLAVHERDGVRRYPLTGPGPVLHGAIAVPLARGWRRHPFWWEPDLSYSARILRLGLEGGEAEAEATPAEALAAFWYGGDLAFLERSFDYRARVGQLPGRAAAGSTSRLEIGLRNMSSVPWLADGAFPVQLSYRLLRLDAKDETVLEGDRVDLPGQVPSGDPVDLVLPVVWPRTPGTYRIDVDLLLEDYAWFAERLGEPLARAEVVVR